MSISIVIPAYNEEKRIASTIKRIKKYMKDNDIMSEIIVVNDASTDSTLKILQKEKNVIILSNERNMGKGNSIIKGISKAKYDLILFTDADLATPIDELKKMISEIKNGYDIVVASRNMDESRIITFQPWYRKIMGKIFPLVVRMFVIKGIKDTQCGFKLMKGKAAKKISSVQKISGYCYDVELLYVAKKNGYRIKEIAVKWVDKKGSKVNPFIDPIKMLWECFIIKYNGLAGRYDIN